MKRLVAFLMILSMLLCCTGVSASAMEGLDLSISGKNISHEVSDTLYGLSLEDISFGGDGGLVSNLVNNGSFEYATDFCPAWDLAGKVTISTNSNINDNNTNYAVVHIDNERVTITNFGYTELLKNGKYDAELASTPNMHFEKNKRYDFSCYVYNDSFEGTIGVYLNSKGNSKNVVQLSDSNISSTEWTKLSVSLKSTATQDGAVSIVFDGDGTIKLDMVSLVPQDSYGYGLSEWKYTTLRSDMVGVIKNMNPSFIRFPGGCLVEGDDLDNLYCWKDTIGPLENRKQHRSVYANDDANYWYNNSCAMGYHEYFQLCEDVGALAVPVVGAGMTCQKINGYEEHLDALKKLTMSDDEWRAYLIGERGFGERDNSSIEAYTDAIMSYGIESQNDFDSYINRIALDPDSPEFINYTQDVLDLIEYANGDSATTYWGALRASNGHDQPFGIKYICVGNENYGDLYLRNFDALKSRIEQQYPDIIVVSSTREGTDSATNDSTMTDEHYSVSDNYLMENNARYDGYDRSGDGVMIGAYSYGDNSIYSAVQECSMMTGFERNGDVVRMTSVAPAFAKINSNCTDKALVWFDSSDLALTPSFYAQMMFANNVGTNYIDSHLESSDVFHSVTVDEGKQAIYVKLVNTSSSSKRIVLSLDGFDKLNSASLVELSHKYKDAFNTIDKQTVAPVQSDLEINDSTISVDIDGYGVGVVRIAYGENGGTGFWQVPEDIDVDTHSFVPSSVKVLAVVLVVGFAVGTVGGYFIYTRLVNKNANPRRLRRKDNDV